MCATLTLPGGSRGDKAASDNVGFCQQRAPAAKQVLRDTWSQPFWVSQAGAEQPAVQSQGQPYVWLPSLLLGDHSRQKSRCLGVLEWTSVRKLGFGVDVQLHSNVIFCAVKRWRSEGVLGVSLAGCQWAPVTTQSSVAPVWLPDWQPQRQLGASVALYSCLFSSSQVAAPRLAQRCVGLCRWLCCQLSTCAREWRGRRGRGWRLL